MAQPEAIGIAHSHAQQAEARLVCGLREARPEAYQELCDLFGPRLYRFAAARLPGDGQAAEEVMIYALADAVRNILRFDPRRSSFTTWLFGIARRKLHDAVRQARRLRALPPAAQLPLEHLAEMSDGRDLAEDTAARLQAQRQAAAVAAFLSQLEFEVLALHCLEGLSAREIAHTVGRSERAVHSILHRARQKARERLAHDG
jgi:RNA polymerase sigma-70 factor (ECF subfamily)